MLLCMASCQKENGILYLITETYSGDAKLHLDSENFAVWDNNDKVLVNGTEYAVAVGSDNAAITGVPAADSYTALFPADWANTTGTTITYPATQTYSATSIDAPMAAYSDGNNTLEFRNLGSVLAVEVANSTSQTMSVQKIEVVAEGSTLINGTASISFSGDRPALGTLSSGSSTTTLKCGGVSITAGNTETFYIAMPPVEAQLTIKVYDQYFTYTKTQASVHTMAASHGYAAPIATTDSPVQYAPMGNQVFYTATSRLSGYDDGDSDNNMTVTSHTFSNGQGVITFADSFTSIPIAAFAEKEDLQSITIPSNVTAISMGAFIYCPNLSSVVAPGVTSIGEDAFVGSGTESSGITLDLPNLTTIETHAFKRCKMKALDFSNVTTIGEEAFDETTFIDASITLDLTNITSIGRGAFNHINGSISQLTLPVSPDYCGDNILASDPVNELYFYSAGTPIYVSSSLGILWMEDTYIHLPANTPQEVVDYWTSELYANEERIILNL